LTYVLSRKVSVLCHCQRAHLTMQS